MTRRILLTRPAEDSERIAQDIAQMGFTPLISPVLAVEPVVNDWPGPEGFQGLILTSARALHRVPRAWVEAGLPVFAVGVRTAQAALDQNFRTLHVADGDGAALQRTLEDAHLDPSMKLLHPCGKHRARTFEATVAPVVPWPVYEAKPVEALSDSCLAHLDAGDIAAALFYSPRSGEIFADLIEKYRRTERLKAIKALCFSERVVKLVGHLPWADVRQANRPDHPAMIALIRDFV